MCDKVKEGFGVVVPAEKVCLAFAAGGLRDGELPPRVRLLLALLALVAVSARQGPGLSHQVRKRGGWGRPTQLAVRVHHKRPRPLQQLYLSVLGETEMSALAVVSARSWVRQK